MNQVIIRPVTEAEFFQTEHITREAFWNLYKPGCDEHLVLHNLRKSAGYIPDLDLVAINGDDIVGHCISTRAAIIDTYDQAHEVLCLGPISVSPESQNRGIGSKLMHHSTTTAKHLNFPGMILFGDPVYYHRFGFRSAAEFGIQTKDGKHFDAFMALELQEDGFRKIQGRFYEDDAFNASAEELQAFEKRFPPRVGGKPTLPIE